MSYVVQSMTRSGDVKCVATFTDKRCPRGEKQVLASTEYWMKEKEDLFRRLFFYTRMCHYSDVMVSSTGGGYKRYFASKGVNLTILP